MAAAAAAEAVGIAAVPRLAVLAEMPCRHYRRR
jgi:hypothetical protein